MDPSTMPDQAPPPTAETLLLVGEFLRRLAIRLGRQFDGVTRGSMEALMAYAWPGNIRELQNVIERAAILAPGPVVAVDPAVFDLPAADIETGAETAVAGGTGRVATLAEAERAHIIQVLAVTDWVVGGRDGAAGLLDLADSTLRSRMKKLGIERNGGGR